MAIIEETTKKPHPFSKEGRALREQQKSIETETKTEEVPQTISTDAILQRLNKLEQENIELKEKFIHPMVKAKEFETGARGFSYKLWSGQPVLTHHAKKKDPSKDFLFKNHLGQYESNHYFVLTLANGEIVEVEANEFLNNYVSSDKIPARDHHGEIITLDNLKQAKSFTFDTEQFGTFTVLWDMIN